MMYQTEKLNTTVHYKVRYKDPTQAAVKQMQITPNLELYNQHEYKEWKAWSHNVDQRSKKGESAIRM